MIQNEIWRIEKLEKAVEKLDIAIRGNGKLGLITRMETMEQTMRSIRWYFRAIMTVLSVLSGLLLHAVYHDLIRIGK